MTTKTLVIGACGQTGMSVCDPLRREYAAMPYATLGVDIGALDAPPRIPSGQVKVEDDECWRFVICEAVGRCA